MKTIVALILGIIGFLVISSCRSHAAIPQPPPMPLLVKNVPLAWDYDLAAPVTGFKIYWKDSISSEWTDVLVVGRVLSVTVSNIPTFRTTYFICTAFDTQMESPPSNTVTNKSSLVPPILRMGP